jgi:hypothetical protein
MLHESLGGPTVEGRIYRRLVTIWNLAPPKNIEDEDDDEYEDDLCSAVGFALVPGAQGVLNEVDPLSPCRRRYRCVRTNLG